MELNFSSFSSLPELVEFTQILVVKFLERILWIFMNPQAIFYSVLFYSLL